MANENRSIQHLPALPKPPSSDRPLSPYRAALVAIDERLTPASEGEIKVILGRLRLHYGMPDLSPEQYQLYWQDYLDDLAHLPADVIEKAAIGWRRKVPAEKYFPKPADLLTIVRAQRVYEDRACRARDKLEAQRRVQEYRPTPEDRAKVAEIMADFRLRGMPKAGPRVPDRVEEQQRTKPSEYDAIAFEARKRAVIEEAEAALKAKA